MLDVKVEFDFLLRHARMNSDNQIKEHGNLYSIPEFQTISWNSPRYILQFKTVLLKTRIIMLSTIICTHKRTNMLDVKVEFDFFLPRSHPNYQTNKERNLNNIPDV